MHINTIIQRLSTGRARKQFCTERQHINRANEIISFIKNIDGGSISTKTLKYCIDKLYNLCPEAFANIVKKESEAKVHEIMNNIKCNPMIFFILCNVLNISLNKQKNLIKYLNMDWSNDELITFSST